MGQAEQTVQRTEAEVARQVPGSPLLRDYIDVLQHHLFLSQLNLRKNGCLERKSMLVRTLG